MSTRRSSKGLTVRELVVLLGRCDPEAEVVMAADPEGNRFYVVAELGLGRIASDFFGEISIEAAKPEDPDKVVVFWPF